MKISHNVPAQLSTTQLGMTGRKLEISLQNLSTAVRLRSAKDNPAGMAIVNKLRFQSTGLKTASKNATDGISIVQTAEGALNEVQDMLQRMKELSVYASTDTLQNEDREKIQDEIEELKNEITAISERTEFNKIKLINGQASRVAYSDMYGDDSILDNTTQSRLEAAGFSEVVYVSDTVPPGDLTYTIDSAGEPALAELTYNDFVAPDLEGKFAINSAVVELIKFDGSAPPTDQERAKLAEERFEALKDACDIAGLDVTKSNDGSYIYITTREAGVAQEIEFLTDTPEKPEDENKDLYDLLGLAGDYSSTVRGTDAVITAPSYSVAAFNSTMSVTTKGNRVEFDAINNQTIEIDLQVRLEPATGKFVYMDGTLAADQPAPPAAPKPAPTPVDTNKTVGARVTDYGPLKIQIGPDYKMELEINIPVVTTDSLDLEHLNMQTQRDAMNSMTLIDNAISEVSAIRAKLGAYQNRLEHAITSLDTTNENVETSRSRIQDTDMATEMATYTSLQVIEQAGMSILAQANARPQEILTLLGNR